MKNNSLNFNNLNGYKLNKNQLKTITGGTGNTPPSIIPPQGDPGDV